jgi:hypothetical protein
MNLWFFEIILELPEISLFIKTKLSTLISQAGFLGCRNFSQEHEHTCADLLHVVMMHM